jgi:glycosyltransferase involved in cell wall biosynthesis
VVTSKSSSLPEVVGGAAILVDPRDIDAIAEAIGRIYTDPDLAAQLSQAGYLQASGFSWDKTADHVLGLYDELLSETFK